MEQPRDNHEDLTGLTARSNIVQPLAANVEQSPNSARTNINKTEYRLSAISAPADLVDGTTLGSQPVRDSIHDATEAAPRAVAAEPMAPHEGGTSGIVPNETEPLAHEVQPLHDNLTALADVAGGGQPLAERIRVTDSTT